MSQEATTTSQPVHYEPDALRGFIEANPGVKVRDNKNKDKFIIENAWGDDTVDLVFIKDSDQVSLLNDIILPERYSAVYHKETKHLEIIYTAYPLNDEDKDILERKFTFRHKEIDHRCYFGDSSKAVIALGIAFRPSGPPTKSDYRNLFSFSRMQLDPQEMIESPGLKQFIEAMRPISFWITNVNWAEDEVLDLVNHMNFTCRIMIRRLRK